MPKRVTDPSLICCSCHFLRMQTNNTFSHTSRCEHTLHTHALKTFSVYYKSVRAILTGVNFSFYSPQVWMTKFSTLTLRLKGRMSVRCALTGRGWMFCLSHCVQAARCQSLLNEDFYLRITSGSALICWERSLQDKIRWQPKQKKRLQKERCTRKI